jgi:hypothetical protein
MKFAILLGIAALSTTPPAFAGQVAGAPIKLFSCSLGGKVVSITARGSELTYHYGTPGKDEISIAGSAASGTVFWMTARYAGPESQLRFKNGDYSYIAFSMEGNASTGASAISGLTVMRGKETISDKYCSKFTGFSQSYDYSKLPEDTDEYSAM